MKFIKLTSPSSIQEFLGPICTVRSLKENAKYFLNTKIDVADLPNFELCVTIYALRQLTYKSVISLCESLRPVNILFNYRRPNLKEWIAFIWNDVRGNANV